jgi:ribonuclease BN (tRNA processing enzyme)
VWKDGARVQEPQHTDGHRPRKVCLLGDTSDSRAIAQLARGCDVLSHESTFLNEMKDKARLATHSTGLQAGQFASLVQVLFYPLCVFVCARTPHGNVEPMLDDLVPF